MPHANLTTEQIAAILPANELNDWALRTWIAKTSNRHMLTDILLRDGHHPELRTDFCADMNQAYQLGRMCLPINIGIRWTMYNPLSSGGQSMVQYETYDGDGSSVWRVAAHSNTEVGHPGRQMIQAIKQACDAQHQRHIAWEETHGKR